MDIFAFMILGAPIFFIVAYIALTIWINRKLDRELDRELDKWDT